MSMLTANRWDVDIVNRKSECDPNQFAQRQNTKVIFLLNVQKEM